MKTTAKQKNILIEALQWINHKVLGFHCYKYVRRLTDVAALIKCDQCGIHFGVHFPTRIVLPFDKEMYRMYRRIGVKGLKKYMSAH